MNYDVPAKSSELVGGLSKGRPDNGRTCLLVLGMHRSGTSALARVLSLAGAELPQRLMGGGNGNEAGHWEPSALVQFHDRMLAEIGSAWHDWRQTDFSTVGPRGRDALKRDIAAIIAEDYGDSPLFVLKDPRICRFADIIIETLEHFGVRVVPILALRNPLDVVGSLKRRGFDIPDDHSAADGALAWLRHMLDADWATRQLPRVIVSYEHVLADWRAQLSKIADVGKVEFPYGANEIATLVDEFIAPDLRHFASTTADVTHNPMLRGWVSDAYGALRILEQEPASKNALNQLDDIRHSFNRAAPLVFGLVSSVRNFSQDKLSQSLAATEQAKQQREAETVAAISQLEAANAQLKQHVESLQAEIASASSALTARDASLVAVTQQVSETESALHRQEHVSRTLKAEGEKLQASLADLSKSLEEKEAEVQSTIAQSNAAEEGIRQRDEAMRALAAEKQTLEDRISELTKLVDSKMAAIDAAAEQASEAERSVRDREEAIAEFRSRLEAAMEQASSAERALADKTGEAEQLSAQIHQLTGLAEAKAAALDAAEHRVRELDEQHTNVEKLNQQLDIQLASLRELKAAEYDSAQERDRALDEKVAELEASLKHVQDELTSLNQELVVTKEREAAARSAQRSLESEIASAREQADEAATSKLSVKQTLTAALTELESRLAEQGCLLDEKAAGLAAEAATARALEQQIAERNQKLIEAENGRAAEVARAAALEGQLTQRAQEIEAAWQASEAARAEIDRTHQMYRSSTSWKLTAPFRGVKTVPRVIGRLFRVVPAAVRFGGGVMPTVRKAVRVWRNEGRRGVRWRLAYAQATRLGTEAPSIENQGQPLSFIASQAANRSAILFSAWHLAFFRAKQGSISNPSPCITISVVLFNSANWLRPFIQSLLMQAYPLDRINLHFVDNGSVDDTIDILDSFRRQFGGLLKSFQISRRSNDGYGAGNDYAIRKSKDDFVLVSNVDVEFYPDSIRAVMALAVADSANVACWELRQSKYEHPKYYDPVTLETSWSSHACVLFRRASYLDVGGYDPRIFMYGEDVELSYRFRGAGLSLRYVPTAAIEHHVTFDGPESRPLQLSGSIAANVLLRYRYGTPDDAAEGDRLLGQLGKAEAAGARSRDIERAIEIVNSNKEYFRSFNRPRLSVNFPFSGFDYGLRRDGHDVELSVAGDKAKRPLVSIITRTHGPKINFLRECIACVLNQTYRNIEHIIVEDRTDYAGNLVRQVREEYGCSIKYMKSECGGRSDAGNCGLGAASGEYLMFLDNDDLLFADHVELLVSRLNVSANVVAAYALGWEVLTVVQGEGYSEISHALPDAHRAGYSRERLEQMNFIPIQCILFRRELYDQFGGFSEKLDYLEDWNLWVRYSKGGDFAFVPKLTSMYRTPAQEDERLRRQRLLDGAYEKARFHNNSGVRQAPS